MHRTRILCVGVLFFLVGPSSQVIAQGGSGVLTIDLASQTSDSEVVIPVLPREDYVVRIINRSVLNSYSVIVRLESTVVPVLPGLQAGALSTAGADSSYLDSVDACTQLASLIREAESEESEFGVGQLIAQIRDKTKAIPGGDCSIQKNLALRVRARTIYNLPGSMSVRKGERLSVTVLRNQNGEDGPDKIWQSVFETPSRGEWRTTFGYSFIRTILSANREYHTEVDGGFYQIRQDENNERWRHAPSVFFTWFPHPSSPSDWSRGLSGGLSFDSAQPIVFLGGSITYNQNLSLIAGIAAHRQTRLLGKYQSGQRVNDELDFHQLHEEVYRMNPFVSVSFRFNTNPFSRGEG